MKAKLTIYHCSFELHAETDGGKFSIPAIEREQNFEGSKGLALFFAPVSGVEFTKLKLFVYATLLGPNLMMPIKLSAFEYSCERQLGESYDCMGLCLTPAQVKQIVKRINAKLPAVVAKWERAKKRVERENRAAV